MSIRRSQQFSVPSGSTVRVARSNYLAPAKRERIWIGLERFVNCGDSEEHFLDFGVNFPSFFPVLIWHHPNSVASASADKSPSGDEDQAVSLGWDPVCHKLFVFYRDVLRAVWKRERFQLPGGEPEFLLGISGLVQSVFAGAKESLHMDFASALTAWLARNPLVPSTPFRACRMILDKFATGEIDGRLRISMMWERGDFFLGGPSNEFQVAFHALFRNSWRAKACPRCGTFFVARKESQKFCGTVCSAGSRLASNLKWWRKEGKKWRSGHIRSQRKRGGKRKKQ